MTFRVPEKYRIDGPAWETCGAFVVPHESYMLRVIASDGLGWEHVSVSLPNRTPSWKQMCFIKSMFWDEEDAVVQFHPPASEYVNHHPHCLHLWRSTGETMPRPPSILVGPKR